MISGNTAQKNSDGGKRTSDWARAWDLHSFAELQPRAISPSRESFIPQGRWVYTVLPI